MWSPLTSHRSGCPGTSVFGANAAPLAPVAVHTWAAPAAQVAQAVALARAVVHMWAVVAQAVAPAPPTVHKWAAPAEHTQAAQAVALAPAAVHMWAAPTAEHTQVAQAVACPNANGQPRQTKSSRKGIPSPNASRHSLRARLWSLSKRFRARCV